MKKVKNVTAVLLQNKVLLCNHDKAEIVILVVKMAIIIDERCSK